MLVFPGSDETSNSRQFEKLHSMVGGLAEWLRHSVSDHARSTRVGLNPIVGTTNHKPAVNSAVHPSKVGK